MKICIYVNKIYNIGRRSEWNKFYRSFKYIYIHTIFKLYTYTICIEKFPENENRNIVLFVVLTNLLHFWFLFLYV